MSDVHIHDILCFSTVVRLQSITAYVHRRYVSIQYLPGWCRIRSVEYAPVRTFISIGIKMVSSSKTCLTVENSDSHIDLSGYSGHVQRQARKDGGSRPKSNTLFKFEQEFTRDGIMPSYTDIISRLSAAILLKLHRGLGLSKLKV